MSGRAKQVSNINLEQMTLTITRTKNERGELVHVRRNKGGEPLTEEDLSLQTKVQF